MEEDYIVNPEVPTPNSKEEYIRLAGDTFHKLMQLNKSCEPEDGWRSFDIGTSVDADDSVELYEKPVSPSERASNTIKTIGIMNANAQDVFDIVWSTDMETKKRYDKDILANDVLEEISPDVLIMYRLYQSPGLLVAPREFVVMNARWKSPEGVLIIYGASVNHKSRTKSAKNVRANIIVTGTVITPLSGILYILFKRAYFLKENSCKVARILQLDLGGYIPSWVINYGKNKAINSFRTLHKIVKEIALERRLNPKKVVEEPPKVAEEPKEIIREIIEENEPTQQIQRKSRRKQKDNTESELEALRDIDVQLAKLNWEVEIHNKRIDYVEELIDIRMQEKQLEAEKAAIKERSTWELAVMVTYITTAIYILMN